MTLKNIKPGFHSTYRITDTRLFFVQVVIVFFYLRIPCLKCFDFLLIVVDVCLYVIYEIGNSKCSQSSYSSRGQKLVCNKFLTLSNYLPQHSANLNINSLFKPHF